MALLSPTLKTFSGNRQRDNDRHYSVAQSNGPWQRADEFLEAVPLRRRPYLCVGMAKRADERGYARGGLDVIGYEYVEVVAWPKNGVAVEPFDVRTFLAHSLHRIAFKLLQTPPAVNERRPGLSVLTLP